MNQASLPPFHVTKTTRLTVEADHALTIDLRTYIDYYAQTHGAKVGEAELLREMARQFMAGDAAFQTFRLKPRRRRRTQPTQTQTEASA